MRGIAWFYRLKAIFVRGVLTISRSTKIPLGTTIIWKRGSVRIGAKGHFRKGVVIDAQKGSIDIGNHVSFNEYTILLGSGGISIGNDVRIAAAEAMKHYRSADAARALIGQLSGREFGLAWQAHNSLVRITGKDLRYDEAAWLTYMTNPEKPFG